MQALYLYLIIGTPLFPILLSFDKRVAYFLNWKWVFLSSLIVAVPFLIWDWYFTEMEFWGFNEDYLVGLNLANLPIEEVSFFFAVPFACTFIYECVKYYFRNFNLLPLNYGFYVAFLIYCGFVYSQNMVGAYTVSSVGLGVILLFILFRNKKTFRFVPLAFVISLLPFLLVNGVLTGSFIEAPIVWYNSDTFSDLRIFTIPMEDVIYGFSLIVLNILVFERLKKHPQPSK